MAMTNTQSPAPSRDPGARLLRGALGANAVFSLVSGAVFLLYAASIGSAVGLPALWVQAIGAGLVGFAAVVAATAARRVDGRSVLAISLGDFGWVLLSVGFVAVHRSAMSDVGIIATAAVAAVVGLLGALQLIGLLRHFRTPEGHTRPARHCVSIHVGADPDDLWRTIADLGAIAEYHDGLASSVVRGSVRTCEAHDGSRWSEALESRDDDERALTLRFLTDEPAFPFPVTEMVGGWTVTPAGDGARVRVWWELTPKAGVLGLLGLTVGAPSLSAAIVGVVRSMAGEQASGSRLVTAVC